MFNLPFWIVFVVGLLVSLGVSVFYGRRAIHPRLRPHFGQVLVVFLIMAMASFFIALVLGKLIGGGAENLKNLKEEKPGYSAPPAAPARPASRRPPPSDEGP